MSNCDGILEALEVRCKGRGGACSRAAGGNHVLCNGKTARLAAIYPFDLRKAILSGFKKQMEFDGKMTRGYVGMHAMAADVDNELLVVDSYQSELLKMQVSGDEEFRDYLIGQLLDPQLVREARAKEMEHVRSKGLWVKKPVKECLDKTGRPPVTVRWVDTNKGDDKCPNIRSRLVAR